MARRAEGPRPGEAPFHKAGAVPDAWHIACPSFPGSERFLRPGCIAVKTTTPTEKKIDELYELTVAMRREALRRQFPADSDEAICADLL